MTKSYKTSESVTEGHPDKVCDIVSDALVDYYLSVDHEAMVSIKALTAANLIVIAGEVGGYKCKELPIEQVVREAIKEIGYTESEYNFSYETVQIIDKIDRHEINDFNKLKWNPNALLGSRDQGITFGYAIKETPELMPLPITLANQLAQNLTNLRKQKILDYLKPDGKTQITIEYENNKPKRAEAIVISTLHDIFITQEQLKKDLLERLIKPTLGELFDENTKIFINPTGRFIVGGPAIDTGLTGRKLIVDTYGEAARHGGGAFSGKDPTSSDRCGAYLARHIAKSVVANKLANECEIELAYAIGSFAPLHITVTKTGNDKEIEKIIQENFNLTISGAITDLQLRRPIYKPTASYGHFGRKEFPWEKIKEVNRNV